MYFVDWSLIWVVKLLVHFAQYFFAVIDKEFSFLSAYSEAQFLRLEFVAEHSNADRTLFRLVYINNLTGELAA